MRAWLAVILWTVGTGCVPINRPDAGAAVKLRASREFSCAEDQVVVEELGAGAFRATACGNQATYVCNRVGQCVKEGSGEALPEGPR